MILKALYDYYHRCDDLAPMGMEYKEIAFLIVIDKEGNFVRIEDCRIDAKTCKKFLVVKGVRSGSAPKPYTFWDNVEYICNYTKYHPELQGEELNDTSKIKERDKAIAKANEKHCALVERFNSLSNDNPDNKSLKAVCMFYQKDGLQDLYKSPLWCDVAKKPTVNMSFRIEEETHIVAEENCLIPTHGSTSVSDKQNNPICLITGEKAEAVESTTPTAIVGGQATARLVSFQVNSGYDSYGKSKGYNASISKEAEACYTTALNRLLAKDSRNKFLIANRTFVFWASSKSKAAKEAEEALFSFFGYTDKEEDDPNSRIESVRQVFNSIYSGNTPATPDDRFYFLGLAPNSARIAVVYWNESNLKDFARKIVQHFSDMDIVDTRKEKNPFNGLYEMMRAIAPNGKLSEVKSNLPEAVIKSILQDIPYPYALLLACISRIRAEQSITIARAAIIKAYLNRINDNKNKKLTIMLDKENNNQGYLCGRLFATLEYAQERSSNGNSNIRERYMNAASATPAAVFPTLINLSVHHVDKLDKGGQVFFEKTKAEIMANISSVGFPTHLDIQDQGRFMVGYYHQRQEFYTSKENKEQTNKE